MTELSGLRCDQCGAETTDRQGCWIAVSLRTITPGTCWAGGPAMPWSWSGSGESHYCSVNCLIDAAEDVDKWKHVNRGITARKVAS